MVKKNNKKEDFGFPEVKKENLTKKDIEKADRFIKKLFDDMRPELKEGYSELIKKITSFLKKDKKNKLELILYLHQKVLGYLLLLPINNMKIGKAGKTKISNEASYAYNLTIAQALIETEMFESGTTELLNEALYTSMQKIKPTTKDISYIG